MDMPSTPLLSLPKQEPFALAPTPTIPQRFETFDCFPLRQRRIQKGEGPIIHAPAVTTEKLHDRTFRNVSGFEFTRSHTPPGEEPEERATECQAVKSGYEPFQTLDQPESANYHTNGLSQPTSKQSRQPRQARFCKESGLSFQGAEFTGNG